MLYQKQFSIISNSEVNPGIHLLWIEAPEIASASQPGQFVMISCGGNDRLLRRPISIHRVDQNKVAFLFAAVGKGTEWLSKQTAGENLDLLGPLGNGFKINPSSRNLLLIAGGLGIAPLAYLAQSAAASRKEVKLLIGAKTQSLLYNPIDLPAGIETQLITEDGSSGRKGLVTSLIPEHADWADQIFLCGPLPMYKASQNKYSGYLEAKSAQVSLEVRMGCGLGFCYACTIKTRLGLQQVCRDGPVFNTADILWREL
jgi:dihydroorotate dehydrogenase electron transfer subunit